MRATRLSATRLSGAVAALLAPTPTFALDFARDQYSTLSPALTVSSPTGGVMVPDYLGNYHLALAGEIPIRGGRRLYNLLANTDTLATQGVTVEDADYWLSFKGTGSVAVTGVATDSLAGTGADDRVSKKVTMGSAGTATFTVTGSVTEAYLYKSRPGQTTEDPEYVSRGVLSSPYHGYGVDGLAWMRTDSEGNSLADERGPEIVVNGDFSAGTEAWTAYNAVISSSGGQLTIDDSANVGGFSSAIQQTPIKAGYTYHLRVAVVSVSTRLDIGITASAEPLSWVAQLIVNVTSAGLREVIFTATEGGYLALVVGGAGRAVVDSVSLKKAHPVPCTGIADWPQITNLAWPSESFAGQAITVTNGQPYTISFRGTGSIAYSGAASGTLAGTGADDLVSVTVTTTTTTLTLASPTGTVTEVQVTAGSVVQPHVPTTSSAVTADAIASSSSKAGMGVVENEFTVVLECIVDAPVSGNRHILAMRGDADNRAVVYHFKSGANRFVGIYVETLNAVVWSETTAVGWADGETLRIALRISENNGSLVINGEEVFSTSSLAVPVTTALHLYGDPENAGSSGSVSAVAIYEGA